MQSFGICNIVANTVSLINKGKLLVLCLSVHFLPHSWVQPRCMYYTVTPGYWFFFSDQLSFIIGLPFYFILFSCTNVYDLMLSSPVPQLALVLPTFQGWASHSQYWHYREMRSCIVLEKILSTCHRCLSDKRGQCFTSSVFSTCISG